MRAERWEGAGNVYLLVESEAPADVAAACRDHEADGVLVLTPAEGADVAMRIINPDGSEPEACGNGTRMVARYVAARDGLAGVRIATAAGVLRTTVRADGTVTARMADARLADGAQYAPTAEPFPYPHRFVSVGNPHVVIRVDDPGTFPLACEGPVLEHHPWFPERTNVEVWRPLADGSVEMRVWERGVGETRACGTGACAVAVAAVLDGAAASPVTVRLPGGDLRIAVGPNLEIELTGPAARLEVLAL
jgi:diaminopimelate epimerase